MQLLWARKQQRTSKNCIPNGLFDRHMVRFFPQTPHTWALTKLYTGLTETCTVVCATKTTDVWLGSSGSLLPGLECKLVTIEGNEITGYDQPGEL